jgi:cytochrome P450
MLTIEHAPGPRGLPLVGCTFDALRDPYHFFLDAWRRHGDVVFLRFGPFRYVLLNDADALYHVLVDNARSYTKSRTYKAFEPVLGSGLLTSEGDLWRRQRRLVQPAFHRDRLAGFAEAMVACTERLVAEWAPGARVDVNAALYGLTLRIVARALFSVDLAVDAEFGRALREAIQFIDATARSLLPTPPWVPTPRNRRFLAARAVLDRVVETIMAEHRRRPPARPDVLSLLLAARDEETGAPMAAERVRDEVMTLLLAGHETTANALTWAFVLLARHPEVEGRLLDELRAVLGGRAPGLADVPLLGYTTAVLQETMRQYPPAWKIEREACVDDVVAGYRVPAGTIVGVTTHTLHRNPRYWPDPERFDPERFLGERTGDRPRCAYLPFGAGPRLCIGAGFAQMEMTLVLAIIAQRYRLVIGPEPVPMEPAVTLHPRGAVIAELRPRAA